jgi:uncharacterized protein YycO
MPKITRPRIMVAASFLGLATALGGTAAAASAAAASATAGQPGTQNQSIHSLAGMVDEATPAMQHEPLRRCSRTHVPLCSKIDQQG